MIHKEFYRTREDGVDLYQRTSDQGVKLLQVETGRAYDDPIDIEPCPYTYEETDIPIEPEPEEDEQAQKAAAYDIIVGGEQNEPD